MEKSNNEIGIVELSAKAINLFKKYWILIICFLIFGIIWGYFQFNNNSHHSYKKKLLFYSDYISFPILNNFSYDLTFNKYNSKITNTPIFNESIINKIEQSFLDTIYQKGKVLMQINFVLKDTIGTSNIFNEYFKYLDSIPYIKNVIKKNKAKTKLILDKINIKLEELESQQNKAKLSKSDQSVIIGDSYKDYIDIFCSKLDYEEKLKNVCGFQIISESVLVTKSNSTRLFNCFKYGLALLLTSFFIIFIIEFVKKIKSYKLKK